MSIIYVITFHLKLTMDVHERRTSGLHFENILTVSLVVSWVDTFLYAYSLQAL